MSKKGLLWLYLFLFLSCASPLNGSNSKSISINPALDELKVSQINSCGTVDRIPWSGSKKGGRRTRRIFRDELTLDREKTPNIWELHQVLNTSGEVAFVFKRIRKDGSEEFIATKGDKRERYNELKNDVSRMTDKDDLKLLINRAAMSLAHVDGSRVEFVPGQTGKSTVILYPTNDIGVGLAPVYLMGISCDKPEDNEKKTDDKKDEKANPPVGKQ